MKLSRLAILAITSMLLVSLLTGAISVSAAHKDVNAKEIAKLIEQHGVIIDGKLGIKDQNKELADSLAGTVVSILNWTGCISESGATMSIAPEKILTASLPSDLVTDADVQLAYVVAGLIKKVAPNLKAIKSKDRQSTLGLLSLDTGYDRIVITDRSYTLDRENDTEVRTHYVLYPDGGSFSYGVTMGIEVSASASLPGDIFSCTINTSATYQKSFTHSFSCTIPGYRAFACYYQQVRYHEHAWDTWYWYIDYPGGPKNYTYCGRNYSNSSQRLSTSFYSKQEPNP